MKKSHTKHLLLCLAGLTASIALTIAAVPLYRLFCQKMGIPLPSIFVQASQAHLTGEIDPTRTITVRFEGTSASGVPIKLQPITYTLKVHPGQNALTAYTAENTSLRPINGVAVHSLYGLGGISSANLNQYVDLQQCFCFELQRYPARQTVTLPLSFTISPQLPKGIHTITFAYTLYEALPNDPRLKK